MFFKEPVNNLKPDAPKTKPTNKPPIPISPICKNSDFKFPSAAEMRLRTESREQKFFRKYRKIIYDEIQCAASQGYFKVKINIEEDAKDLDILHNALTTLSKGLRKLGYAIDINAHYSQEPLEHWASKIIDIYAITVSWEGVNGC